MSLPQPGDPLVRSNGKIVEDRREPERERPVVSVPAITTFRAKRSRSVRDLPADTQTQSVLNAVLVYTLLGLTDNEIAHVLNVSVMEVQDIKNMPQLQETFAAVHSEILSAQSQSLQARVASYATEAVENVMDLANQSPSEVVPAMVVLKANQDILDRSGMSADTLYGKGAKDEEDQTLRIEVISGGNDATTKVNIDLRRKK